MIEQEFIKLKEEAKTYQYNSFEYLEYEPVKDYTLIQRDKDLLLMYGKNHENNIDGATWAANDVTVLSEAVKRLGQNVLVSFIPKEWKAYLTEQGFSDYVIYREYWIGDLTTIDGY